ncbi:MarR family transcriptional regulator [Brachybacterium huguangmaarense]|uniref:MarR family transcriptional regulator n=1 Tax=Brachybacterium huguangmaarense TaxID=1652028 RepID=A0ABY6FYS1_9MICO|nr:MarR family transcriptional regulator [Brachybacterium huguangmaarense]UYG15864.1 MarR family transcriptional regulator [Brachybacterium huguangmaarense]
METVIGTQQGLLLQRLDDEPEATFILGLLATGRRIDRAYNALLAEHELSGGRFATLLAVNETPGITPARLAEQLDVTRATVTGLVERLVARDLLVRGTDPTDRRLQTLTVTEAGAQLIEEVVPLLSRQLSRLAAGVPQDGRDATLHLLALVRRNLDDGPAA